jgi:sugar/nucleoside kinase (ribokinase family)
MSGIGKALIRNEKLPLVVTVDLVVAGKLAIDELSFEGKPTPPVLGGAAAHVALAAATAGAKVAIVSSIGEDFPPQFLEILDSKGIDLSGVVQRKGKSSHFWANFAKNGAMTEYRLQFGVGNKVSFRHLTRLSKHVKAIHLGILPPHLQRKILHSVQSRGKLLSMTTIFHQAQTLRDKILLQLPLLDVLFLNTQEAVFLTRESIVQEAIKILGNLVPLVIVTQGPEGCTVNHKSRISHVSSFPTQEVDATGAGDSFAGAFLAKYLQTEDILLAAQWGNAAGAVNVRQIGSTALQFASQQDLESIIQESY